MHRLGCAAGLVLAALGAVACVPAVALALDAAHVIDGDTISVAGEKVRLAGIDAPEMRAQCRFEDWLARRATVRMSELVADGVTLERHGVDRYRRTLAVVFDAQGRDVGAVLVAEGLAREWHGRRLSWCQ